MRAQLCLATHTAVRTVMCKLHHAPDGEVHEPTVSYARAPAITEPWLFTLRTESLRKLHETSIFVMSASDFSTPFPVSMSKVLSFSILCLHQLGFFHSADGEQTYIRFSVLQTALKSKVSLQRFYAMVNDVLLSSMAFFLKYILSQL